MNERQKALAAILNRNPGNDAATQRTRILTAMQTLGSVTSYEGSRFLDCYDPRARIHELRNAGHSIVTVMRAEQTESGVVHRVGVYVLSLEVDAATC
jgi:serine phosphatase RsbU (regulator of sigma subunit)